MARIKANVPAAGTQASLRRYIVSLEKGAPNYDEMTPALADTVRAQLPGILQQIAQWGALTSITFRNVDANGMDVYDVAFARGKAVWRVGPLVENGKVAVRGFQSEP